MKNISLIIFIAAAAFTLMTGCGSARHATDASNAATATKIQESDYVYVGRVSDNASTAKSISSSIDFTVSDGKNEITVGGKLRMKRDEVIRINLVALGLMEVGIIEFTPTYVLLIDRYHGQYVKESYDKVDFLAENGLSFYSLQSLFWNELFYPGTDKITESVLRKYSASFVGATNANIGLKLGDMTYSWMTESKTARIINADLRYVSKDYGTTTLHWSYSDFKNIAGKAFPYKQSFNLFSSSVAKGQKATVTIVMNKPEVGKTFDVTTTPSSKYKKVAAEDLLRQLLSM